MKVEELLWYSEQRKENETINQTRNRLEEEGNLFIIDKTPQEEKHVSYGSVYSDELTIPRWKLVQPSCQIKGATPGHFRNTLTDEEIPKLEDIVFLRQQNSRSLFEEGDFTGAKICWTYNGYTPAIDQVRTKTGLEPKSSLCAKKESGKIIHHCPFASWRNEIGEPDSNGIKPPLCKASISFLGIDLNCFMPFWIVFHGASFPIVKQFLKYIQYRREQTSRSEKQLGLYDFKVTIGLELKTIAKGKFYIPSFEKKEEITDLEEKAVVKNCYQSLKHRFLSEPLEVEEK